MQFCRLPLPANAGAVRGAPYPDTEFPENSENNREFFSFSGLFAASAACRRQISPLFQSII
jgi:hypothetical protein